MQPNLFSPMTKLFQGEGNKYQTALGLALLATMCFYQMITFFSKVLESSNGEVN